VKLSSSPEIGLDGDVLLTPYVPKGITGYDDDDDNDDDDDDDDERSSSNIYTFYIKIENRNKNS
jgi:hypothetical protein